MKNTAEDRFAEAARLFSENEAMFGHQRQDKEKANLYRGLAALAEGLAFLEQSTGGQNHETKNRISPGQDAGRARNPAISLSQSTKPRMSSWHGEPRRGDRDRRESV